MFCLHVWMCATYLVLKESVEFSGTEAMGGCKLPSRCWDLNLGPLPEKQVLLTAEPSMSALSACMPARQKRAPDSIIDGCEPLFGFWD